jgi:Holliday junction DNA helicase RuvA
MIAWIQGSILKKTKNSLFIASPNVAYEIFIGEEKIDHYQERQNASFFVFAILKDKWFEFYGFPSFEERELFQIFLTVSGLGPKYSCKIIQNYELDQIINAIELKDSFLFEKIPGIGKKTAGKIILDLEKKISKIPHNSLQDIGGNNELSKSIFSALQNMGFHNKSILQVIQKTVQLSKEKQTFESFLKSCLKELRKDKNG